MDEEDNEFMVTIKVEETMVLRVVVKILLKSLRTKKMTNKLDLTEGEIAALLGHEIGHILHRHSQRRIIQQHLLSLVTKALVCDDEDDDDKHMPQSTRVLPSLLENALLRKCSASE